jgi:hypothetical protein
MMPRLALVVSVIFLAGCSDDASDEATPTGTTAASAEVTTVPTTTAPASAEPIEEAFSFADDDLCEWVTDEDVAEMLADVFDWSGTLTEQPKPTSRSGEPEADNCHWVLSGNGDGHVAVYDAGQWETFGGAPFDLATADIVAYSEGDPDSVELGAAVSGHPALSDGVVVYNGAFGQYAFWVPPRQEYLAFSLAVPGVSDVFEGDRFFMVADQLVHALGWLEESR